MSPRKKALDAKEKAPPPPIPLRPVPAGAKPGTVLLRVELTATGWLNMNPTARSALRVPLGWTKRKGVDRPVRLRWSSSFGGRVAWLVAGSAPAAEVSAVLSAAGVSAAREALAHSLRRIPMGAIMTDPSGNGARAEVESQGMPLLACDRRGRWRTYSIVTGATWPRGAAPVLAEHVAGVEGYTAPTREAPARYGVEEGVPVAAVGRKNGMKVVRERRTTWVSLEEALAEMVRAALADARVNRPRRWRTVDLGTGAKRAETKLPSKGTLRRVDFAPGRAGQAGAVTKVALPAQEAP